MAKKLTLDARTGLYRRDLGKKESGGQHRFYLGRDESRARIASQRLQDLWDAIERSRTALDFQPVWDDTTLAIGQAIARGDFLFRLELPDWLKKEGDNEGKNVIQDWLHGLREDYGSIIGLQLVDASIAQEAEAEQAQRAKSTQGFSQRLFESVGRGPTGETLHRAIDAYIAWNERKYLTAPEAGKEQRTSQTGKKQAERAARLKVHHTDCPLDRFGVKELDAMIEYWANRPKMEDGSHYSFWTCKHQIRLIRHFFRWLHKNADFVWRKPQDYEFDQVRVLILVTENGTSYIDPTVKNNRGARLPNTWNRLIARIKKDKEHEAFRELSIGKLRKTASDLIKRFSNGETASVFLCHGKTVKSDPLLENYTNRHWGKVYTAQDRVWEYLQDIFVGGFVCKDNVDAKLSLGTIKRIHDLRRQGFTVKHIAKVLDVAESTVRIRLRNPSKGNELR